MKQNWSFFFLFAGLLANINKKCDLNKYKSERKKWSPHSFTKQEQITHVQNRKFPLDIIEYFWEYVFKVSELFVN